MVNDDVFIKLNEAIKSGNQEEIDRVKREILLSTRDTTYDENFINSIKGKTLHSNLKKVIEGVELSRHDYMKFISSMMTHIIIESDKNNTNIKDYGIIDLYITLGKMINEESEAIDEAKELISSRYSKFILG